ncbi:hypothetical protein TorRG33x02_087350 [Trema orientale]|uniref:Uncharacterized protein n=1 Tax=Trema orientale TaxID=63057 RepID=A0A2P5FCS7_TREOI|nr:hypothetical protein TorRG33x02_087350 [Trema orientale]
MHIHFSVHKFLLDFPTNQTSSNYSPFDSFSSIFLYASYSHLFLHTLFLQARFDFNFL